MKKLTIAAMLMLSPHLCNAVVLPFISCTSISSTPSGQRMAFALNTNYIMLPPANPTDRQAKISFNGVQGLYNMKQITSVGTGTVYHFFQNHANLEINLPLPRSTLTMSSAIKQRFYTVATLEYKNSDYFGVPYQVFVLRCQPVKPFAWQ